MRKLTADWAGGLLVLLLLAGCHSKPVAFSLDQAIPMGSWVFTISQPESLSPGALRGFPTTGPATDKQTLAVHVSVRGLEQKDLGRLQLTLLGFRVTDGAGKRYGPPAPVTAKMWNLMRSMDVGMMPSDAGSSEEVPEDWVVLFLVPQDASNFSLHMSNPQPHGDQPVSAVVRLGR